VKCKYIGEKGEMEDKMGSMVGYRNNDAGIVYEIQGLRTFKIEDTYMQKKFQRFSRFGGKGTFARRRVS
jgi:hypothetical protein